MVLTMNADTWPVIFDAVRTPIGKRNGQFARLSAPKLLAEPVFEVLKRSGVDAGEVDQLVGGCVTQAGMQAANVTRNAWLSKGQDFSSAATTIDCQCGSGLQANNLMAGLIATGGARIGVACGVEHMTGLPLGTAVYVGETRPKDRSWPWKDEARTQFEAAERIADLRGLTRNDLEVVGAVSQQRAQVAWESGRLEREVMPVDIEVSDGDEAVQVIRDEGMRETTMETLAGLKPVVEGARHTAGTSSQISDGAAAVLWMNQSEASSRGLQPRATIAYHTMVGTDPKYLLDGPVHATQKMLDQTSYKISDFDVFECNEAFASVFLSWQRTHEVPLEKANVNGGAIALGHPVGATGVRLVTTALYELERVDGELALITMCQGGALGIVTVLERLN
jgi:acetyl-CoA C-acetyltransferase